MNGFKMRHLSIGGILLIAVLFCGRAGAEGIELKEGDVVAFVGGESVVRLQERGLVEASLTENYLDAKPKFRDLAWEGDTVYFQSTVRVRWRDEAFGGWDEQLKRVGATVVVAQFGTMESLDGVESLGRFEEAYLELVETLRGEGRRVVLVAPDRLRWEGVEDGALGAYAEAVERVAARGGCGFVRTLEVPGGEVSEVMLEAVREKHRVWRNYWMPDNWKCLFGDDKRRVFAIGSEELPTFQEEWGTYPALIGEIEAAIFAGAVWEPRVASTLTGVGEVDVEAELAAFEVLDGFEVNLFADESHGIANPLAVRWDARGRMYVACSDDYPQGEPGTVPDDKVMLLEDKDGDGRADASLVFAGGLSIPTGMEVGADEVYVGHGTELLRLRDTDGDGVADDREVLLRGFGNGDSHQTANSFVWVPSGDLWFCQGDGIESRVETPQGVSSLFQAGVFRLRLDGLVLDGLLDDFMGPGNPWGVVFDDFGQSSVVDGAGGISFLTPASIPAKRRLSLPRIGKPGGYCGVECLGAGNWPEAMQGQFLVGDYKKNQVSRYRVEDDGAGFKVEWLLPLLKSAHRNFRPIDVKTGPDGAVYVVDWYNPITCHQDDFYRHPERDKTHGRIWRIAPKGKVLAVPDLVGAEVRELLEMLGSEERWTRLKAKQVLVQRGVAASAVEGWGEKLTERELYELVGLGVGGDRLVERLMGSEDFRMRAFAARAAGRLGNFRLLERAALDGHPRVRMEAVLAAGQIPEARSVLIAAAVAESPMDRWVEYAFSQAVEHLKRHWVPALREGELDFGRWGKGLAVVLEKAGSGDLIGEVRRMLGEGEIGEEQKGRLTGALAVLGGDEDVKWILEAGGLSEGVVMALGRRERPEFDVEGLLGRLIEGGERGAVVLAGKWGVEGLRGEIIAAVGGEMKVEAIGALREIGGAGVVGVLEEVAMDGGDVVRFEALEALLRVDLRRGVEIAAGVLREGVDGEVALRVLRGVVGREGGGGLLAAALEGTREVEGLRDVWVASGLVDGGLEKLFEVASGEAFDEGMLRELVEAGKSGDARAGRKVFESARAGCAGCHRVGEVGGVIGPDLSAVGSGILPERIVTEVMWPARQVKEGYSLSQVTLKDGRVVQGYEQASREEEVILLRDFVSGALVRIATAEVVSHARVGSLMPATAQGLSREELGDLLAYLFGVGGSD